MGENRTSSPSRRTHTTLVCSWPSGWSVDTVAKFLPASISRARCGSGGICPPRTWSAAGGPAPAPGVLRVLGRLAGRAEQQRPERIDHDSCLVGGGPALLQPADRRLDRAGLRAVGESRRVQGDRADADPRALAGRVVAAA